MVEIKNHDLKFYLEMVLNKPISMFTEDDLKQFETLVYEVRVNGEDHSVNMEDLSIFPNVRKVVISDGLISQDNITSMKEKEIKEVRFNRCAFDSDDSLSELSSIESIELIGSFNDSYDFLKNMDKLTYLAIANPYLDSPVDVSYLSHMNQLSDVTLQNCQLKNIDFLSQCEKVSYLNLLGDVLPKDIVSVFNQMPRLQRLFVSEGNSLEGLKSSIDVRHSFNDFLFEKEEIDEPTGQIHL